MHTIRPAPAARAAAMTHPSIGRPHTGWRTLGSDERMRVPWPAAMMSAVGAAGTRSDYRRVARLPAVRGVLGRPVRRRAEVSPGSVREGSTDLSCDCPGEWCNRQHGTLWMFKTRFESWLPSSACDRRTAQAVSTAARRALSPRLLPRDPARLRAALGRRPGRRRVAKHAHRLEAQAEPLATVARADVEGGQLAHALEPVADGVPVGEQA